jgi:microcystin-dependent protein
MGQPYIGEIRMFGGNFAPSGWEFCEGQLMDISTYDVLFNLIGTTYGGDGQSTFALPDLRGRVPIHNGSNGSSSYTLAQTGGAESVTLTAAQLPSHTHAMAASTDIGTLATPKNNVTAQSASKLYRAGNPTVGLNSQSISSVGGSQPHENRQPYLCVSFIISLYGIYPTPT